MTIITELVTFVGLQRKSKLIIGGHVSDNLEVVEASKPKKEPELRLRVYIMSGQMFLLGPLKFYEIGKDGWLLAVDLEGRKTHMNTVGIIRINEEYS